MLSMPTEDEATRMIGGILDATTALQYVDGNEEWQSRRRRKIEPDSEEYTRVSKLLCSLEFL